VIVLAVAAPALLVTTRDAAIRRASMQQQIVARWLVCEKIEDVVADRHGRGWSYVAQGNYPAEPAIAGFGVYSRTTFIAETGPDLATPGTGYRRVTVTVSYPDAREGSKSFAVAVVLTNYDQ